MQLQRRQADPQIRIRNARFFFIHNVDPAARPVKDDRKLKTFGLVNGHHFDNVVLIANGNGFGGFFLAHLVDHREKAGQRIGMLGAVLFRFLAKQVTVGPLLSGTMLFIKVMI